MAKIEKTKREKNLEKDIEMLLEELKNTDNVLSVNIRTANSMKKDAAVTYIDLRCSENNDKQLALEEYMRWAAREAAMEQARETLEGFIAQWRRRRK